MDELTLLQKCVGGICFMGAFATMMYVLHLVDKASNAIGSKLFTRKDS